MVPATRSSVVRPAIVYIVLLAGVGAYFPYISVFFREIGLSLEAVGLLAALNAACGLVAAPAWGAIVDAAGDVRRPLLAAALWSAVTATLLAVAREPAFVAFAVALLAVGAAGLGPMLDTRTIELLGDDRDRFGRVRAWGSIAFIVVSLATGVLIDTTGSAGLFLIQVPAFVLTGLAAYGLLGRPGGPKRRRRAVRFNPTAGLAGILRVPTLAAFFVGSIAVWTAVSAASTFISIHLVAVSGDAGLVGVLWAAEALVEVPLMFAFPAIARRFGTERLLVLGAAAFALRAAGWALASGPLLLLLAAPLGGVGFALFYVGTVGYVARVVPREVQATAQGLFSGTAYSVGVILGSLLAGAGAGILTIPGLFGVAAVGTAVGTLVVWYAIARIRGEV